MRSTRRSIPIAPWLASLLLAAAASGAEPTEPVADPAVEPVAEAAAEPVAEPVESECDSCPAFDGWLIDGYFGLRLSSGAEPWSGRFGGARSDGLSFDTSVELLRIDADGTRWEVSGRDLASDGRSVGLQLRQPGRYLLGLDYRNTPSLGAIGARTPFRGVGGDRLTLPPGWDRGDTTGDLSTLADDLRGFDVSTERERWAARASWWERHGWETSVEARRDIKRGTDLVGGSFLTRATLLPEPIDQRTDSFAAAAAYAGERWDVAVRYAVSTFDSGPEALAWDNPFDALHPTADVGRLALAPDNEHQQASVDARWRLASGVRLEGGVSLGEGSQDAALLPATANPGLTTALPRASTDASVDTRLAFARAAVPLPAGAVLRAEARFDSRQVDAPADDFTQVVTDTYVGGVRTSIAHGYDRTRFKVEGDWRYAGVRLQARVRQVGYDRDYGASTDETSLELSGRGTLFGLLDWGLEVGADRRDRGSYVAVPGAPVDNPRGDVSTWATLERDRWAATLGASPTPWSSFALRLEQRREDYPDTEVGLTDRDDTGVGFDASFLFAEDMALGLSYQRQVLASDQAGSQTFSAADWTGRSEDATEAFALTFDAPTVTDQLALSARFSVTDSTGVVVVDYGPAARFPETLSKLTQLLLQADYRFDERIALRVGLRFERLDVSDWAMAGVGPATVPNLLSVGQDEPDVELDVLELGVRIAL